MKKILYFSLLLVLPAMFFLACEPAEQVKPDIGEAPEASDISFTIANGNDAFHFVFTNTSPIQGMAKWDFGNGATGSGDVVTAYFPLPGSFEVTLSIYTTGGSANAKQTLDQEATDYSLFTDPLYVNLSGGADAIAGKTWVLDSISLGHLGVGPADAFGPDWWKASPLGKTGTGMYDDELNFNLNQFVCTYTNNGLSYVKSFRVDDPAYSNPIDIDGDFMVQYQTPVAGNWSIIEKEGNSYLVMNADSPIFPNFDTGAQNNEYLIKSITANSLELSCIGGDDLKWHYILIPKGYARPQIHFDLSVTETSNPNEYTIGLANVEIPAGFSVSNISWNLGNGETPTTTDVNQLYTVVYNRAGTYMVSVTLEAGTESKTLSTQVVVAQNHPDYVEYLLNEMVMYNDFGETILLPMSFDASDGSGGIETVENPDNSRYPNRSLHAGLYTKNTAQWANAYMQLPLGYRFNLVNRHIFKLLVYGNAGDVILLKLENTDMGGVAWETGAEIRYTIQSTNTWEVAEYNFAGVGSALGQTADITTDPAFNNGFYNVVRIMQNPADNSANYSFYLDDLAGPHIEGLK